MSTITGIFTIGRDATAIGDGKGANFSVAENHVKKVNGDFKTHTTWYEVVIFGYQVEKALKDAKKGLKINIAGDFSTEDYTIKSGEKKTQLKINCYKFDVFDILKSGGKNKDESNNDYKKAENTNDNQLVDDDLPF